MVVDNCAFVCSFTSQISCVCLCVLIVSGTVLRGGAYSLTGEASSKQIIIQNSDYNLQ